MLRGVMLKYFMHSNVLRLNLKKILLACGLKIKLTYPLNLYGIPVGKGFKLKGLI
jgi:hypothetical protein